MKHWIVPALLGVLLAGCQTMDPRFPSGETQRIEVTESDPVAEPPPPTTRAPSRSPSSTPGRVARQVAFPAEQYAALEKTGTAVISGRLTLSGTPLANRPVSVAPVTTYSAEAAEQALAGRAVERADPRAQEYTHTTYTNNNGYYRIGGLPSGQFYVSASGKDPVTGETEVVIQQVSLGRGEERNVDLAR